MGMIYLNNERLISQNDLLTNGTNLLANSELSSGSNWSAGNPSGTKTPTLSFSSNGADLTNKDLYQMVSVSPGATYTFSFNLHFMSNPLRNCQFFFVEYEDKQHPTAPYADHRLGGEQFANTAGFANHSYTFKVSNTCNYLWVYIRQEHDGRFQVSHLKLEQGNIATPWTPAPQDYQDKIDNLQAQINELKSKNGGVKPSPKPLYYLMKEVA